MATLSGAVSAPALLLPETAAPGGPWVLRNAGSRSLPAAGRIVARPPAQEAAAIAWKARRKETLQGQLGTGNKISSVVQYPVSTRDPLNMCNGAKRHLTAEDRRILRVRVKHQMKGRPSYPDSVYMVEEKLLKGFVASGELCNAFFSNESFANKLLLETARALESNGASASTNIETKIKELKPPGQHGPYCGPMCYCLKLQDAPLRTKTKTEGYWQDSFAEKTKSAAASVVASVATAAPLMASGSKLPNGTKK